MPPSSTSGAARERIKPGHKAIKAYYARLEELAQQNIAHESAIRSAFQTLLTDIGRAFRWTLIPELSEAATRPTGSESASTAAIRPDGTFRDEFYIDRGHWEAKDSKDNLEAEIKKKITRGYPTNNIIFEDTRQAQLYQSSGLALKADLTQAQQLADLLNQFFAYTEPAHDNFEKAVDEFRERVPEYARSVVLIIDDAHKNNPKFQKAFAAFHEVCKASLNPNLSQAAVDEMLVQHLLTERLIRTIFNNPQFTRRNVIAAEVEKVIDALTSHSFDRDAFLKNLDRFYVAIEMAAATISSFAEKQHFLNVVYERFFQGFSVKVADTHGIVYTPQPIVDFMCASVAEVLEKEFGKKLGDPGVNILDPCTGTGNFIVNLMRRVPRKHLPRMYREQFFANEVMLMPYYIAALNIEHAFYEITGDYEPFEGLCFVDTLELADTAQHEFGFMSEVNTQRVERQRKTPITVVIGNPPYNAHQLDENDNSKNREYRVVEDRVRRTYAKDSTAANKAALWDPYVKFFRWATDRLEGRDGIVCMVSNNSFVDQIAFDGMRKHLAQDFTTIYHVHLEGNVRHNPTLAGTTFNVFGIQVGVGVTIAVRHAANDDHLLFFERVDKLLRRYQKLAWLAQQHSIGGVQWKALTPDSRFTWLVEQNTAEFAGYVSIGGREAKASELANTESVFKTYSRGLETTRDDWVYGFSLNQLTTKVGGMIDCYNGEIDRWKRSGSPADVDGFVTNDSSRIKWSSHLKESFRRGTYATSDDSKFRHSLYRPFCRMFVFFDRILNQRRGELSAYLPNEDSTNENRVFCLTDLGSEKPFMCMMARHLPDLHLVGAGAATQCFPFFVYNETGGERRENITDWALKLFRGRYADNKITKWDIFHYVYGLLHHAGYRAKFADNLKRNLPRIPLALTSADFRAFRDAGALLAKLHVEYESLKPWELNEVENPAVPLSYRVERMKLNKEKTAVRINDSLTLAGIPPEVFTYRLGNRSALDWVIDQYQITRDAQGQVTSDPNRADDPEYIVRLVGQVVRVSMETAKIVAALPPDYGGPA